jgi:predicted NBD/HSP70 family sugar kinase
MGVLNDSLEIIAEDSYPFDRKLTARECIDELGVRVLKLLEKNEIPLEQCIGVGVGIPGTIDRREGKVVYSNNIRWEDVPIVKQLGRVIPCPVRIANNADCAALGEQLAGAGKDYTNVVMFVLGNGVGGGVILNGEVFEGGVMGGSEIGHMVVRTNGRQCTCGRKGCLEAYASVRALKESAAKAAGRLLTLEEIFEKDAGGDIAVQEVIEQYEDMLGNGVVNLVNLFRPQLVLIGGEISDHAARLMPALEKMMREDCFGGAHTAIPDIAVAELGGNAGIIGAAML